VAALLRAVRPECGRAPGLVGDMLGACPRAGLGGDGVLVGRGVDAVGNPEMPLGLDLRAVCWWIG
jgi:hypothetical protein